MKTNKETLQTAMDRRLSFLDDLPSCRAAVQHRIAQEEEPVMKRKMSVGFVFAMVLVLLSVAALATTLLLSPRAGAARTADLAMAETRGITAEMMTFFCREEEELPDGAIQVTYTGVGSLNYVLGTYTALVRNGRAEIAWSRDGEDTSGGYEAEAWGAEQLKQLITDSQDEQAKKAYTDIALAIAARNGAEDPNAAEEDETADEPADETADEATDETRFNQREADKTAALQARRLSEEEMIAIAREFIISNYGLSDEKIAKMDENLYTNSFRDRENTWYEMVNGQPCFQVEYLMYEPYTTEQMDNSEPRGRSEMDGFYNVYVNVETGVVEEYEYNSALHGEG